MEINKSQNIENETNYCKKCNSITCQHSKYHICKLHLDFLQKIYKNEIGEFLLLNHNETQITSCCNDKCIQAIVGKYNELESYLNNMKFYYLSLMPQSNGFYTCPIDIKDFENYLEGRISEKMIERVEMSIKFKLINGQIYLNNNLTQYQKDELMGLKYTTGSFPSLHQEIKVYEINSNTPNITPSFPSQ